MTEGTILEWRAKVGDAIKADETIVEISTDKVDIELPSPATGMVSEILVAEGETVTVGQVIARIALDGPLPPHRQPRRRRPPARRRRRPPASRATARLAPARPRRPRARRSRRSPRAPRPSRAWTSPRSPGSGPAGRITKSDVLSAAAGGAAETDGTRPTASGRRRGGRPADEGRRGGARPLHGRVALDPHGDELPHAHRHRARRPPPRAEGGRPEGLLHPPDRLRDRARRRATCR